MLFPILCGPALCGEPVPDPPPPALESGALPTPPLHLPSAGALANDLSESTVKLTSVLGRGSFATVYRGVHRRTGHLVAVKLMKNIKPASLAREHRVLELLPADGSLPGLLRYLGTYALSSGSVGFVTELCKGGEVFTRLTRKGAFDEEALRTPFRVLCACR